MNFELETDVGSWGKNDLMGLFSPVFDDPIACFSRRNI